MSDTMIDVNGARLVADRSGALWWPEERLLAVADLPPAKQFVNQ